MEKLSNMQKLGIIMSIVVIILILGPFLAYISPSILLNPWVFWSLFLSFNINSYNFWKIVAIYTRKNINKIALGKSFEYIFFIALFIASYALSFIIAHMGNPSRILDSYFLSLGFSFSMLSAGSSGWLYYIEGLKDDKYWKPKSKKKKKKGKK